MKTLHLMTWLIVALAAVETATAQLPLRPDAGKLRGPGAPLAPSIVTHIPSAAGGERGIAVGVLPPLKPRYTDGAPLVIHVPGGVTTGGTEGRPEYAGLGFVEIRFAFPGGVRPPLGNPPLGAAQPAPPRTSTSPAKLPTGTSPQAKTVRGYLTFVVNTHDWGRVDKSADTVLRLIELFTKHKVRGDFYLTAPVVEAWARSRPEVIERLRASGMTISYHFRPPHPAYGGFDGPLRGLDDEALRATLKNYETFRLDLASGGLKRDQPGGYAYVKQMLGVTPVVVSAMGNPRAKTMLLDIYREMGARMTMEYHESGTEPGRPFAWRQGLLIRPSDFSITRWAAPGEARESFWWNRQDTPQAAEFNPAARLKNQLAAWKHSRTPLITALIHENDFSVRGGPSWNAIYLSPDGKTPRRPPYDLNAPDQAEPRTTENQTAIWHAYEELVAFAAENLAVVTSADIVRFARTEGHYGRK